MIDFIWSIGDVNATAVLKIPELVDSSPPFCFFCINECIVTAGFHYIAVGKEGNLSLDEFGRIEQPISTVREEIVSDTHQIRHTIIFDMPLFY